MRPHHIQLILACLMGPWIPWCESHADEPFEDQDPKILKVDGAEPVAEFALDKAVQYLDRTSMAWTNKHKCFTCHTNFAHLIAVSDWETKPRYFPEIEKALLKLVDQRWPDKGPRWDAEVVMAATTLAFIDKGGSLKLSERTRLALDRMWKVQRKDGGFSWLKCNWPPMESDDEYGAAIAAVGVSAASEEYRKTPLAAAGITKLKAYIQKEKLKRLHHRAMLLWADSLAPGWLTEAESRQIVADLLTLQRPDGGWNSPSLGKWSRDDGAEPDFLTSDGYGTGFAIYMLRKSGMKAENKAVQKGLKWLHSNQRESGRWYTRSMSRDNRHYLTHAGTAMAIMAIRECGSPAK